MEKPVTLFQGPLFGLLAFSAVVYAAPLNPNGAKKPEAAAAIPAEPAAIPNDAPPQNEVPAARPVLINATTRNEKNSVARVNLLGVPLILAPDASENLKKTAEDMARVLEKMTGQKFEVTTGDGSKGIVLGTLEQFPAPGIEKSLEVRNGFEGVESYAIRTSPGRVLILGAREVGAIDGAYRFLGELGCRWLAPSPKWEIIPANKAPVWNHDITDRPELLSRSIWYKTIFDGDANKAPSGLSPSQERLLWNRRNAQNESFTANTGEYYDVFVSRNKAAFDAHPEYWPLINGERMQKKYAQPELGNPEVRKLLVEDALARFRADREAAKKANRPEITMVSVGPNDGGAWSQSEEFKALGSISDAVFGMANEVARAVQKEFPGKMVGLYAYREWAEPPSFPLEPNVHIQLTPALFSKFTREQLIEMWRAKTSNMGFYDYYGPYYFHFDMLPGPSVASYHGIATRIRDQLAHQATSISGESSGGWMMSGLGHWIANQMMWDSSQDVDALATDYFQSAFGPAAETMREFYATWNMESKPIISKNLVYQMALLLQKAVGESKGRPDILARLDDWKNYLRYVQLYWQTDQIAQDAPFEERKAAFVELMRHVYRTRYDYILSYGLATQGLWQKRAEKTGMVLVEKTGKKIAPGAENLIGKPWPENPWKDPDFYTSEEIEKNFQEVLTAFKAPKIEEKTFSNDLVAIEWQGLQAPGAKETQESAMQVQGGNILVALHSLQGEAVRVRVEPGKLYQAIEARPWTLTDSNGKEIARGGVAPDDADEKKSLSIAVPKAGTYFFQVADSRAGFLFLKIPPDQRASFVLRRGVNLNETTQKQPRLFYVPKGTKEIQFFYDAWAPGQKVTGPDGKILFQTPGGKKEWTSVPVPNDMDGRVWRLDTQITSNLWFANIPPYVAATPERLLVPREVAEKDRLKIRTK